MATELEELRRLYIEDLSKIVYYGGKQGRSRVRNPKQYANVPHSEGIDISDRKVWVWSDLHFEHKNIINFCNRPFTDKDEMKWHLIENFNDYVGPDDVSIWVGDVAFCGSECTNKILDRCNGYKILVVGNHDMKKGKVKQMNFDEVHLLYTLNFDEASLVFTHYPMDNLPWPMINVHGHIHDRISNNVQHINVSCECIEYKPVNLDTIRQWAHTRIESYDR